MASMHDHGNYKNLIGLGELEVVLNGVEFRTRHNDYTLQMPHRTKKDYHLTEEIPFPGVPKEVTDKKMVKEQIEEMREWFKAFKEENSTHRDYKKYFKPVLCYLEGAWTETGEEIDPPFHSDRHQVEADTWHQMQDQIRFTSYTGRKNLKENFLFLPNKIVGIKNDTTPRIAQWNYRILCHPLKQYVNPSALKPVDDLASRFRVKKTMSTFSNNRAARFRLHDGDLDNEKYEEYGLLDKLMEEIPGLDNYPANIVDDCFGMKVLNFNDWSVLNAGRYHRRYRVPVKGGSGEVKRLRGFSDDNLFVAFNTRDKIYGPSFKDCTWIKGTKKCKTVKKKVSYAIPLEIIYLNPLSSWNPYNIEYKGHETTARAKTVTDERDGSNSLEKAFNGSNSANYYLTPAEFFTGKITWGGAADTSRHIKAVLPSARAENFVEVAPSGVKIFLPQITGIGTIRQRYPIIPVYGEGSGIWKELEALKDAVMESKKYKWMYREEDTGEVCWDGLQMSLATTEDRHNHKVWISNRNKEQMDKGETVTKESSKNSGHSHSLKIKLGSEGYEILRCDGELHGCLDGHNKTLTMFSQNCF